MFTAYGLRSAASLLSSVHRNGGGWYFAYGQVRAASALSSTMVRVGAWGSLVIRTRRKSLVPGARQADSCVNGGPGRRLTPHQSSPLNA